MVIYNNNNIIIYGIVIIILWIIILTINDKCLFNIFRNCDELDIKLALPPVNPHIDVTTGVPTG